MAHYDTLVCDHCSEEARTPVFGWILSAPSKGSTTEPSDQVKGDWCSTKCLVAHFTNVQLQEQIAGMEAAVGEARDADEAKRDDPRGPPQSIYQRDEP